MNIKSHNSSGFRWVHDEIGSNLRLTEMQSVIGRSQIRKLNDWNLKRKINANIFIDSLSSNTLLRIPTPPQDITHAWYRFYAYVNPKKLLAEWNRDRIIQEIQDLGVPIFSGSCSEIYLEKCFQKYENINIKSNSKRLPIAKQLGETSLCFLVHPNLRSDEIEYQIKIIKEVLKKASN
jgi:dTDP-4-amino-4,6-dideoxygalactose transaminase